jgi:hypothetical protein
MRRLLLAFAAVGLMVAPAAALAAQGAAGDGTLVVRNASGDAPRQPVISAAFTGAIVGQVARGRIVVVPTADAGDVTVTTSDLNPVAPVVTDAGLISYSGVGLRFKAVGGFYRVLLYGKGVDVNIVGQGSVVLDGSESDPQLDGRFSLNGASWHSLPPTKTAYQLAG